MVNLHEANNIAKANNLLNQDELVDDNCNFLCYLIEYIPTDIGFAPLTPTICVFSWATLHVYWQRSGPVELKAGRAKRFLLYPS